MTTEQLYEYLNARVPRTLCAPWDNDGLSCCPESDKEVSRVLVALDATEQVVDYAIAGGFDLLLTHHPLLFRGIKALTPETTVPRKLIKLARGGVSAISLHTRLDALEGGVNDVLAERLGLLDAKPFAPEGEVACGRIGTLPTPVLASDFAKDVCRALDIPAVLCSGDALVSRVAVLGGEGGDFVDAARASGADLFLAGRIGYHRMLDGAEDGIVLMEAGHFATELPVCEVLVDMLYEADPSIQAEIYAMPAMMRIASEE